MFRELRLARHPIDHAPSAPPRDHHAPGGDGDIRYDYKLGKIDVENDTLTVQAERKQPSLAKGETLHRSERAFGTFFRAFTLPKSVAAARVEARYDQGVLTVVLPKREEAKPRSIAVQVK